MTQSNDKDYTFDISDLTISGVDSDTVTINMNDYITDTIDISTITTSTIDTGYDVNLDWTGNISFDRVIFEDYMPDPQLVKNMGDQYPALAKAYENFKTIYKMVEQDWKGNYEDDEELPF